MSAITGLENEINLFLELIVLWGHFEGYKIRHSGETQSVHRVLWRLGWECYLSGTVREVSRVGSAAKLSLKDDCYADKT